MRVNMTNSRIRLAAVLSVGAVLFAASAQAATIYVSPNGNDGNSGSAPASPLKSISAASNKASAGDRILLMSGTYSEPIRPVRSGQAGSPITYEKYGSDPVVIRGSATSLRSAFDLTGVSHIVIDGIDIDGVAPRPNARIEHFATITNSRYITIRNGKFKYAHGWHGIGVVGASEYVTIEDNVIDWVGTWDAGSGTDKGSDVGDSITIESSAQRVLVQRNKLYHGGHNLMRVAGRNCVIQDNVFNNDWRDVLGGDAGQRSASFIGRDNLIQRNVFSAARASADSTRNTLFKVEGTGHIARQNVGYDSIALGISSAGKDKNGANQLRIYNNTLYRLGHAGWMLILYGTSAAVGDNSFVNNLIVDSRMSSGNKGDTVFKVANAGQGPTANSTMFGNIVYSSEGKSPEVVLDGFDGAIPLSTAQSKYPSQFWKNASSAVRFKSASPRTLTDFDLQATSTGIDQGQFLTHTTGSGNSRQLPLKDARYFTDGFGLIQGDSLQLEGTNQPVRAISVDYASNIVTLEREVQFSSGQGVALVFSGVRPDVGAREFGSASASPKPPQPA